MTLQSMITLTLKAKFLASHNTSRGHQVEILLDSIRIDAHVKLIHGS